MALPKQSQMISALQQVAMGGQATFVGWNGYGNVLNLILEQKQLVNLKSFFAMVMTVTLMLISLHIAWIITSFYLLCFLMHFILFNHLTYSFLAHSRHI